MHRQTLGLCTFQTQASNVIAWTHTEVVTYIPSLLPGEYSDQTVVQITVLPQNQHKPKFISPALPNTTVKVQEVSEEAAWLKVSGSLYWKLSCGWGVSSEDYEVLHTLTF